MFEGYFYNEDTEVEAWSQVEGIGYYCSLHGP